MQFSVSFLLLLILTTTQGFSQKALLKPDSSILFEVSQGKSLLKDCSGSHYQDSVDSFWIPNQQEYTSLQANFYKQNEQVLPLTEYIIQYLGVVIKGEKFIYINAFPKYQLNNIIRVHKDLKTVAVGACGGGSLYWRALFNCKLNEFSNVQINAPM